MKESILTRRQTKEFTKKDHIDQYGDKVRIVATVRYDDNCGNGHNTFGITADIYRGRRLESAGCQHEEVANAFPELAPFIKWHLTSSDGPMHYIADSVYHAKEGNLEYARSSAVWPAAELSDFTKEKLEARLPALLAEFRHDVESLGFVY